MVDVIKTNVILSLDHFQLTIIHNYGHGGSGVTLSWGCAGHVLALVETVFKHKQ